MLMTVFCFDDDQAELKVLDFHARNSSVEEMRQLRSYS